MLLILVVMILVIIFTHSLIRLCMLILRPPKSEDRSIGVPSSTGPSGYAQPEQPIPVVMLRDEEMAVLNDGEPEAYKATVLPPPPAYGLWRSSVVSLGLFLRILSRSVLYEGLWPMCFR